MGEIDSKTGRERREFDRIEARFEVRFEEASDAARALRAYSVNFSVGGLCLKVQKQYNIGETLRLSMSVEGHAFDLQGIIAWVRNGVIGVRFINVAESDRIRLVVIAKQLSERKKGSQDETSSSY